MYPQECIQSMSAFELAWCRRITYKMHPYQITSPRALGTHWLREDTTDLANYLKGCRFLSKLNNELADDRSSAYKERFASLQNLVLIMFEQDTVLIPKETSWLGCYPDGTFDTVLPAQEIELYNEDWIGLKTLKAGKVKFIDVSGNHLQISLTDIQKYIAPYLVDDAALAKNMATGMASSSRTPWVQGLYRRMARLFKDWLLLLLAVTFSFYLKL